MKSGYRPLVATAITALGLHAPFADAQSPDTRTNDKGVTTVRLSPAQKGGSAIGTAVFEPYKDHALVTVHVGKAPSEATLPLHLYVYLYAGTCSSHGNEPALALTEHVLATSEVDPQITDAGTGPAKISETLPWSMEHLRASPYALAVQLTPADANTAFLCGDL